MSAARACPHCGDQHPTGWHLRDAGDIPAAVAITAGYCPTLAHRRGAR